MIRTIFKKYLRSHEKEKPFSAWQIELTTRCPLRCKMCIRSESKDWQFHDMAFEDFKKILPYLKDVQNVILEGWGESLLYKYLTECIQLVKQQGARVGFVTSGKGLTEKRVFELIEAGLDFVGFSIAGINPETHKAIRIHSDLEEMLATIRLFIEEKRRRKIDHPHMHFVFLMLKDNIHEVPGLPFFAKKIGIDEVFLTNIIHITSEFQNHQKAFSYQSVVEGFDKFVNEAEANAKRIGVKLKRPNLLPEEVPICEENPLKNLYISSNGEVAPCVYLYPPIGSPFRRIFYEKEHWLNKVSFGNIFQENFQDIWNSKDYIRFRDHFIKRENKFREISFSLLNIETSGILKEAKLPNPPEPCRSCHKILGF